MSNYNLNHACVSGNLTCDPIVRSFPDGRAKVFFGLAVHEVTKKRDGTFAQRTNFFEVIAWSPIADSAAKYTSKGDGVIVDGRLVQDVWEGKDGAKHEKVRIEAARICFNNPPKPKTGTDGSPQGEAVPETPAADIGRPAEDDVAVPF